MVPASAWSLLPQSAVSQPGPALLTVVLPPCPAPASLAYLWAESPVTTVHGLPLYSQDTWGLPANPWWIEI